jgi:FAD/FMN-containing dehydrogenase
MEVSIPIDSGRGLPLFVFAHSVLIGLFVYLSFYGTPQVKYILVGLILYGMCMIGIRLYETKVEKKVPTEKGWATHTEDVAKVHQEFQEFLRNKLPGEKASINRFKHGAHESHRTVETKYKETSFKINMGSMDAVIEIDKEKKILHVQPGMPMDEMALITIAHGFIPQVVPEFPGITVGGAIGGVAGESTGHKYGLFHDTIEEMDVITGDGVLQKGVSRTNKADLFWAMCGSYGTQGILVRAAVRLVHAPNYVRVQYYHMDSMESAVTQMETLANGSNPPEFLDGVALSPTSVMVLAGYPSELAVSPLSLRGSRTDPWFFWYLTDLAKRKAVSTRSIFTDFISLDDYLFRFDRGAFWAARHGMMFLFGKGLCEEPSIALRSLWSWIGSTRQMYKMCHSPGDVKLAETYIVQDFILPTKEATVELTNFNTENSYHMWPLWICPIRKMESTETHSGLGTPLVGTKGDLMFNLGFYGPVNGGRPMNPIEKNKELEQKVFEVKGKKWLYAQSFYSEDEFWAHFHKETYDSIRSHYKNDEAFHDITKKVLLSSNTKESICTNCSINLWGYLHKIVPILTLGYLEILTPRLLHPFLGIDHTQMMFYTR